MMEALEDRGRLAGEARAEAAAERLANRLDGEIAGVSVSRRGGEVTLAGKRLLRRAASDTRLRWIAGWLK